MPYKSYLIRKPAGRHALVLPVDKVVKVAVGLPGHTDTVPLR